MAIEPIEIQEKVEIENLYRHVLALEGVKHPLETPQALAKAAAYLSAEFHQAGVQVRLQPFKLDGFEDVFYNVEAWVGDENQPAVVLVAHYDNVWNDPGANDNAAALAVMLETARLLGSQTRETPHVRFLAVSLEEGNPALEIARRESLRRLGLVDENWRWRTYASEQLLNRIQDFTLAALWSGDTYGDGYARYLEQFDEQLSEEIHTHLLDLTALQGRYDALTSIGIVNRIGSSVWLREALKTGRSIRLAICLDEIGTVIHEAGSQRFPSNMPMEKVQTHRVDLDQRVGDFILAITDDLSVEFGRTFLQRCRDAHVDLPCLWLPLPTGGMDVARQFPQALGSDHAPFWLVGLPALSLTDTAYLRNPYSHTPADTIDKVNFTQIRKVCQAVLATILS
jgi:hypothetical protein